MKSGRTEKPITLSPDIIAKCDAGDRLQNFDMFRAAIVIPKETIVMEEAKWKRASKRSKRTSSS